MSIVVFKIFSLTRIFFRESLGIATKSNDTAQVNVMSSEYSLSSDYISAWLDHYLLIWF